MSTATKSAEPDQAKEATPADLRRQIASEVNLFQAKTKEIEGIEAEFKGMRDRLEKLVKQYNHARLDKVIAYLISKDLAYCNGCDRLVRESDFMYEEKSGTHVVTRNTYWDYEEPYHYKCYKCTKCNRQLSTKGSIRKSWIAAFRSRFANERSWDFPHELVMVLPKRVMPPEPIKFSDWDADAGQVRKDKAERTKVFAVNGRGIRCYGYYIGERRRGY